VSGLNLRPDDEFWFATVDDAIRKATRTPQQAIDYGAVSLNDHGWSQRQAQERRSAVLACLVCLGPQQAKALELVAWGARHEDVARTLRVRKGTVGQWVRAGRQAVAIRLQSIGLMAHPERGT
jgi:DNA-directed RNA polymerase specialized sigma24 family protein